MTTPADEHRSIAGTFTDRVRGVPAGAWDNHSPVADWRARDVVRHLVEWFPPFLESGSGIVLPPVTSVDEDPVAAWEQHAAHVQQVLDEGGDGRTFAHRHIPETPLPEAISRFYTSDIFMHTWDLARATGQDERLDQERCRVLYEGMLPIEQLMRDSGQYGPRVDVPDDADWQTKMLAFIGRKR